MSTYQIVVNGKKIEASLLQRQGSLVSFLVAGARYDVEISPILAQRNTGAAPVIVQAPIAATSAAQIDAVCAPMPGIIVNVLVKKGDSVKPGQTVAIMEAMKMENNVATTRAGIIKEVLVKTGEEVANHQPLVKFE
jgi:biotin carboxyl carrier protein